MRAFPRTSWILAVVLLLPAAGAFAQNTGSADFSKYVAMGDSLTAAFTSAGLAESAQRNSFPLLIHRQASAGEFEQPLVSDPGLPPLLQLVNLDPLTLVPKPGEGVPQNLLLPRPYDNLGVPGATVGDVVDTITDDGGAHDLILRGLGTQLQQAQSLAPTFVTLWIGNNDALAAATSGLVIEGVTLTPLAQFEADYRAIVGGLTAVGAQLALGTIPPVTSIPFVTAVPPVIFVDPATGTQFFAIGPDGLLGPDDFLLLTASELLAQGIGIPVELGGTGEPLPDTAVLSAEEANTIQTRVNGYNDVIRTIAAENGAALMQADVIFDEILREGLEIAGLEYTAELITGGIFSYDGVHPTPFGYAIIANELIAAINETYGADIPPVSLFDFIFGEAGRAPQVEVNGPFVFSSRAFDNLAWGLGLPSAAKLEAALNERPATGPAMAPFAPTPPRPNAPGGAEVGVPEAPRVSPVRHAPKPERFQRDVGPPVR